MGNARACIELHIGQFCWERQILNSIQHGNMYLFSFSVSLINGTPMEIVVSWELASGGVDQRSGEFEPAIFGLRRHNLTARRLLPP